MGIIRKTFMFWLITGVIAALAISFFMPELKTKVIEKIPGRDEAMQIVERAKTAITKLPDQVKAFRSVPELKQATKQNKKEESIDELEQLEQPEQPEQRVVVQDSIKGRDAELFKRQCAILDDLL
jgi:hypothetical protein